MSSRGRMWQQKRGKRASGAAGGKDCFDPWYRRAWRNKYGARVRQLWQKETADD